VASPVNRMIRAIWDKRKPVIDNFITPFSTTTLQRHKNL